MGQRHLFGPGPSGASLVWRASSCGGLEIGPATMGSMQYVGISPN